ncbi:hypothetical protein O3G_MSEX003412 [Manduca sexta]|nr:hypothetical protein O3G_MSEX003412 [Manduca sexta]
MTAVISCIVTTLTIMLGVGIGLGYNYCFVDMKLASYPTTTFLPLRRMMDDDNPFDGPIQPEQDLYKLRHRTPKQPVKPTMIIPLNKGEDIPLLLAKLRGYKKNVTLELVA